MPSAAQQHTRPLLRVLNFNINSAVLIDCFPDSSGVRTRTPDSYVEHYLRLHPKLFQRQSFLFYISEICHYPGVTRRSSKAKGEVIVVKSRYEKPKAMYIDQVTRTGLGGGAKDSLL